MVIDDGAETPMVIFNTGWMKRWRGPADDDQRVNGGAYVARNERGGEMWNFLPMRGRFMTAPDDQT